MSFKNILSYRAFIISFVLALLLGILFSYNKYIRYIPEELTLVMLAGLIPNSIIYDFEREHKCKVHIDIVDSNDVFRSKLEIHERCGWDVALISSTVAEELYANGMIEDIDYARFETEYMQNYIDTVSESCRPYSFCSKYSIPYTISASDLVVRKEYAPQKHASWTLLIDDLFYKKCSVLREAREVLGIALLSMGCSPNTRNIEDIHKIIPFLRKLRHNVSKVDSDWYFPGIILGDILLAHNELGSWGDPPNREMVHLYPNEGLLIYIDAFTIMRGADNKALVYKFIEYMMQASNVRQVCEFGRVFPATETEGVVSIDKIVPVVSLANSHIMRYVPEMVHVFSDVWLRFIFGLFDDL